MIREKQIEKRLVNKIKAIGGIAYKFNSPGRRGVPDRLVIVPRRTGNQYGAPHIVMVECKSPTGRLRPDQEVAINQLMMLGVQVYIIDSYEAVDDLVERLKP